MRPPPAPVRRPAAFLTVLVLAACSGHDPAGPAMGPAMGPATALTGTWTGSSALYTMGLSLTGSGTAVTGRGWLAQDQEPQGSGYGPPSIIGAVPVVVSGSVQGTSVALTFTVDDPTGALVGYGTAPVSVQGTVSPGSLALQFTEISPGTSASARPPSQSASLTPDADTLASGRFTLTARPPGAAAGSTAAYDAVRVGTAFALPTSEGWPAGTFFVLTQANVPQTLLQFAGGRPAVGRYAVVATVGAPAPGAGQVGVEVDIACTSRCTTYRPAGAAAGEVVVTRSTAHAVSGTYRFTAALTSVGGMGGAKGDTLVFAGTFDAPCGQRGC